MKYKFLMMLFIVNVYSSLFSFSLFSLFSNIRSWFSSPRLQDVFEIDRIQNQGDKEKQEDAITVEDISAGVFDGHGPESLFIFKQEQIQTSKELRNLLDLCKQEKLISVSSKSSENHAEVAYICDGENAAQWFSTKIPQRIKQNLFGWKLNNWLRWLCHRQTKFATLSIDKAYKQAQKEYCQKIEKLKEFSWSDQYQDNIDPGTTAALVTLYKNNLYVSHMGDSRVVIVDNDFDVECASKDHTPHNKKEMDRIKKFKIEVKKDENGCDRVASGFIPSRSLGHYYDQVMSQAGPEIVSVSLEKASNLVAGSDGFFDYLAYSPLFAEDDRVQQYCLEESRQNKVLALLLQKYYEEKESKGSLQSVLTERAQDSKRWVERLLKEGACDGQAAYMNQAARKASIKKLEAHLRSKGLLGDDKELDKKRFRYQKRYIVVPNDEFEDLEGQQQHSIDQQTRTKRKLKKTHDNISIVLALRRKNSIVRNNSVAESSSTASRRRSNGASINNNLIIKI